MSMVKRNNICLPRFHQRFLSNLKYQHSYFNEISKSVIDKKETLIKSHSKELIYINELNIDNEYEKIF